MACQGAATQAHWKREQGGDERSTSIRRRGPRKETFATPFFAGAPSKSNTIYRKNSTLS